MSIEKNAVERRIETMTPEEIAAYMRSLSEHLETGLPPGSARKGRAMFLLLVFDEQQQVHYISNANRDDVKAALVEFVGHFVGK